MTEVILDTHEGGYPCYGCSLPLAPDEEQVIIGQGTELQALCKDCLESGEVLL